jgi:hypothetical protein
MDMFFVWLGFILVAGGFVYIGIWQKKRAEKDP